MEKKMLNHEMKVWMLVMAIECGKDVWHTIWRAPKSRGETNLRVSQSQVAEVETWRHAPGFQL
jgi:hypothetical protein